MIQRRVAWKMSKTRTFTLGTSNEFLTLKLKCDLFVYRIVCMYGDFMRLTRTRRPILNVLSRPLIWSVEIDRLSIESPILFHLPQNCYHAADLQRNNHTLCSNQVLVGVMSSRRTSYRYADRPISSGQSIRRT